MEKINIKSDTTRRPKIDFWRDYLAIIDKWYKAQPTMPLIGLCAGMLCLLFGAILMFIALGGSLNWAFEAANSIGPKLVLAGLGMLLGVSGLLIVVLSPRIQHVSAQKSEPIPSETATVERHSDNGHIYIEDADGIDPTHLTFGCFSFEPNQPPPHFKEEITAFLVKEADSRLMEVCIDGSTYYVQPFSLCTPASLTECKAGDIILGVLKMIKGKESDIVVLFTADKKWFTYLNGKGNKIYMPECGWCSGANVISYLVASDEQVPNWQSKDIIDLSEDFKSCINRSELDTFGYFKGIIGIIGEFSQENRRLDIFYDNEWRLFLNN